MSDSLSQDASDTVCFRGQSFQAIRHAAVAHALAEFRSPFEAGTLRFFDSVLPFCDRMIDVGAYVGLMSLYAAGRVEQVRAFEASPTNFALLARNVAANPGLRDRIQLFDHGLGDRDAQVPLYRKAVADSGSSIFRTIERRDVLHTAPEGMVTLRAADAALRDAGWTAGRCLRSTSRGRSIRLCRLSRACWRRRSRSCICPSTRSTSSPEPTPI